MLVALFGITDEGLNLFVNLVVLFLVVVWIALVAWTYLDARRRIQDPVLVACATGASLFPFVGTIVYAILRPPEFLEDARERRAGDPRRGAPPQAARGAVLPQLRLPDRAHLPALSGLQGSGERAVRVLPEADRPALDDLPLLRDAAATRRSPAAPRRARPPRFDSSSLPRAGARAPSAPRGRRSAAQPGPAGPHRPAALQARPASSRQASAPPSASRRSGRPDRGRSAERREAPGEERPRPAPAS